MFSSTFSSSMVSIEIIGKSNQKPVTRCKKFLNSSTQQGKEGISNMLAHLSRK